MSHAMKIAQGDACRLLNKAIDGTHPVGATFSYVCGNPKIFIYTNGILSPLSILLNPNGSWAAEYMAPELQNITPTTT